jgi:NADH-quinone oxidoreductase subunit N
MSLYYYARVVKAMYVDEGECTEKVKIGKAFMVAILLCVAAVIVLGVYPEPLLDLCEKAAIALL